MLLFFLTGFSQNSVRNTNSKYQSISFNETDTYLLASPISRVYINHPNVLVVLKSNIEINIDTTLELTRIQLLQDSIGGYQLTSIFYGDIQCQANFITKKAIGDTTSLIFYRDHKHFIIKEI